VDETSASTPPAARVARAPYRPAKAPAARLPNGPSPTTVMEYSAIIRPRYSSGISVCMVVFAEAICRITLYPMSGMIASEK
jgi:hypothetical protein